MREARNFCHRFSSLRQESANFPLCIENHGKKPYFPRFQLYFLSIVSGSGNWVSPTFPSKQIARNRHLLSSNFFQPPIFNNKNTPFPCILLVFCRCFSSTCLAGCFILCFRQFFSASGQLDNRLRFDVFPRSIGLLIAYVAHGECMRSERIPFVCGSFFVHSSG